MKSFITLICISMFSTAAFAKPLLERQLFNSRNGENFLCVVHDDGKVVMSSDNGTADSKTKKAKLNAKVSKWITELKADSNYATVKASSRGIEALTPEKTDKYVQRGLKKYSVVDGQTKVAFYELKGYMPKLLNGKADPADKAGSLSYKMKNYQQLKGEVDAACKLTK